MTGVERRGAGVGVEVRRGSAAALHGDHGPPWWSPSSGPSADAHPEVVVRRCEVDAPALVLGSTQDADVVDVVAARNLGLAVVRRRSGGGAVLLQPGAATWVDVFLPADHPRWEPRIDRSFDWVSACWLEALGSLGVIGATAHRGPMVADELGRLVCFAGRGPGEVLVGERKLVGLSQRRTRAGARLQCLVPHHIDVETYAAVLRPGVDPTELSRRVTCLDRSGSDVVSALVLAIEHDRSR